MKVKLAACYVLIRNASGFCAGLAMIAGCGGSQPPIGPPGAMPQSRAAAMRGDRYRPALRAGASGPEYKTNGPLLYATNFENLRMV